jgi:site-specific recombinase XerD
MRRAAKCFIHHLRTERNLSPFTIASYDRDIGQFIDFVEKHRGRKTGKVAVIAQF